MGSTGDLQGWDPVAAPTRAQVSIAVTATPVLSYALAHNRVPVVSRLALTAAGGAVRGGTVRLSVRDAEGPIGAPVELLVDLDENRTTVLPDLPLVIDPAAMLQIDQQRPGVIDVELEDGGVVLAAARTPVQVLAAQQWLGRPMPLAMEMLAAHVMPNHPAVTALVGEASEILDQRTGSPAVQGYQSGPERVDEIVVALTEAMQRHDIRYSEPPASWADLGQQVRTPGDVLTWRVGTPLDTVVLLAAALEQAGIRPLLWLTDGHAFLGYWREERGAESTATTDVAGLVNCVDLGLIGLVETTLLTSMGEPGADLHQAAYDGWLTGDLDRVLGVTDVARARRDGILPLPARARDADGVLSIVEYHPAVHSAPARPVDHPPAVSARPEAPPRVQQWKNALLDLSLRNRLINYSARSGLGLTLPGDALGILENFVHDGTPITLLASDRLAAVQRERGLSTAAELPSEQLTEQLVESRTVHADVTEEAYLGRLRTLSYKAKTVTEETGANNLYLALGSLVWELDGRPLRSPLVLVPVVLTPTSRDGAYRISLDEAGTSTPNYCLLEKLRQLHGMVVPTLADASGDTGIGLDTALEAMRVSLVGHGLPYRVEATADLAILQFAKFRLWKDLDEHWADFAGNPLVAHLVHEPTEPFVDPVLDTAGHTDLDELAAQLPVPADATQLRAVAEAAAGRTFVLEGPPGTGKSQTITNLLSRAVADGKRVLFVAEKRAALDVVARRLEAVGMGPFALDLHDKGSRASTVRAQIRAALEHAVAVDEQGFAADGEALRSARRMLARYADRLHAPNAAGLSLYTARTAELTAGKDVAALPVSEPFVALASPETFTAVRRALALLPDIADLTRPSPRHAWAFVDSPHVDALAVQDASRAVDAAIRELPTAGLLAGVLRRVRTPDELDAVAHLLSGPPVGLDVLDETPTELWTAATSAMQGEVAAFMAFRHPGLDVASPEALALPLAELYVRAQTAAASGWFGRRGRLNKVKAELAPYLLPDATVKPKDVPALVESLWRVQSGMRAIAERAGVIPGLAVPADWNPFLDPTLIDREVTWLRRAGAVIDGDAPFHVALRKLVVAGAAADPGAAATVARARDAVRALLTACCTTSARLSSWTGDDGFVLRWSMTRPERGIEHPRLNSLRRWVSFLDTLEPLRAAGLEEARTLLITGAVPADDAVRAFERGVAEASVAERADATGLDLFDAGAHEKAIHRFTAASRAVRAHLTAALPATVLAGRPFDPATGAGQIGALQRELARQRRGLGVRGLLAHYGDLITAVMPCVLVSPDSVARFFPAQAALFDLVVFDEASQIRVADAVGALGRARAAVVVGDSRQMPPTSFAEPSGGSDDSFDVSSATDSSETVEDEESILSECVQARVPRQWLSWHYRSQDESLIAFSNAQYYENRLSSFPAPTHGRPSPEPTGRGVSLIRVPGTFLRSGSGRMLRTNPIEAEAVVTEIRKRFALSAAEPPSIGVVTFNAQQRSLIETLLRDADDDRLAEALDRTDGEGLFVKNLENVQGDERDVVFFSTGFSVNEKGQLPLNFGPLNRTGGERRLNVAVTRARRQVVVFSSFDPEQLRAEETSSVGIKHLRAYLDLAALGTDVLPRDARRSALVDRHREEIAATLRSRGLHVTTDVGLSEFRIDLSVCRPGDSETPVMAVLLDGPPWARRQTVGDRDGLPIEVLGGMLRWPVVERVWLPSWLADPSAVVDRLVAAVRSVPDLAGDRAPLVAAALAGVAPMVPPPAAPPASETYRGVAALRAVVTEKVAAPVPVAPRPAPGKTTLDGEATFAPWTPKTAGDRSVLDGLPATASARVVRRVLAAGVKAEGPIHVDRLARLAAAAFGVTRVTESRKAALLSVLPPSAVDGEYLWPDSLDR
ncbi:MAG: putative ATP-dependent helicase, partial [Frankiales bacterium]|nr:putative ATP-dependent helicase [Frankiales bacterium]